MSRLVAPTLILLLVISPFSAGQAQDQRPPGGSLPGALSVSSSATERLNPPPSSLHTIVALPLREGTFEHRRSAADLGLLQEGRDTPRWLKWGLVGAGVGAVTFLVLGRTTIDSEPNPPLQDAALGAAAGFVIIGGSIALYDLVCAPGSASRRWGLCGR